MDDKKITIRRWLIRAEHDLLTARAMLRLPEAPTDVVCYHSQQCMEKTLKAWLVHAEVDFPKTHNLRRLLNLCALKNEEFLKLDNCAIALTDYAAETRYVDDWREIPMQEAIDAAEQAKTALDFVRQKLRLQG